MVNTVVGMGDDGASLPSSYPNKNAIRAGRERVTMLSSYSYPSAH